MYALDEFKELCIHNKYTKWYFELMSRAVSRHWDKSGKYGYVEKHHIIPKSIIKNNYTVCLTAKEHFISHLLLSKMLSGKNKSKMSFALKRFMHGSHKQISSNSYDYIKKLHSEACSERTHLYWQTKTKQERSLLRSGSKNGRFGKPISDVTKDKIGQSNKGKLSKEKHPLWGTGHSLTTKQKLSDQKKGKPVPHLLGYKAVLGKKVFNDGLVNKYFCLKDEIPSGWSLGRIKRIDVANV